MKKFYSIVMASFFTLTGFANAQESQVEGIQVLGGQGLVVDEQTNLMWQRCLVGSSGKNCSDNEDLLSRELAKKSLYEAQEYVQQLNANDGFAGYHDWRLPTLQEIQNIHDRDTTITPLESYYDARVFPSRHVMYTWTSTDNNSDYIGVIYNYTYDVFASYQKNSRHFVRLVRDL